MSAEDPVGPVVATSRDVDPMAKDVITRPESMTDTGVKTTGSTKEVSWATIVRRTSSTPEKLQDHVREVLTDADTDRGVKDLDRGFEKGKGKVK